MQLYSKEIEMKCIKTLVSPDVPEYIRSTLLGKLDEDYFHFPPAKAAYTRIAKLAKVRFEMIEYDDLVEDPSIEEDFRDIIKQSDSDHCSSKKAIRRMLDTLSDYRKLRFLYKSCKHVMEHLKADSVNADELLDFMSNKITKARRDISKEQKIVRIGEKTNAKEIIKSVLNPVSEALIESGFEPYDKRNGGLPEEGVMIIAATTSGGKSVSLMQLCKNIYDRANKKKPQRICRVSLEMSEKQELRRLMSNLTGIPFWKFTRNKLNKKEKKQAFEAYRDFVSKGKATGSQYDVVCPTRGITADEAFQMLKPYGYNIAGIDYISLLEGVDVDNQWRILSSIARSAKVFSRETKSLVILLCQLDDETDRVRYSKGLKEHCDVLWRWNYSKPERRETRILNIVVDKARDAELFTFDMRECFDVMSVLNLDTTGAYSSDDDDDTDNNDEHNDKQQDTETYALS